MSGKFALKSFIDLYNVAKENHAILLGSAVSPTLAFNLLGSLNHLMEWAEKDQSLDKNLIPQIAALRALYNQDNHSMWVIRQICNAHKHFTTYTNTPQTDTQVGFGVGRFGKGPFGVGEPSYRVTVNGVDKDFLEISAEVIAIWDNFVTSNGL